MSTYYYKTQGTCSQMIMLEVEDDTIKQVEFQGGCNGNLKGISRLIKGRDVEEVADILEGTTCGFKQTSCPDQLAHALRGVKAAEHGGQLPANMMKAEER
jgi:uncharacterized protein (TIGR03905 family)